MLVGFHGYGEGAEPMFATLQEIADPSWCVVSVQALHRFYTRSQDVVASWMTRQDRELEIANNTTYVWGVVDAVQREYGAVRPLILAGFSQGVAMAYRAAIARECDGLIVLAGDVPPDVAPRAAALPPVLSGRGVKDEWYSEAKASADRDVLTAAGVSLHEHVFNAGHVWDTSFIAAAQKYIRRFRGLKD
jgi:predicted esterase